MPHKIATHIGIRHGRRLPPLFALCIAMLFAVATACVHAQDFALATSATPSAHADGRWEASISAFEARDRQQAPPHGAVVLVGSSSIRLWKDAESQFSVPIVRRGFGGSRLLDCAAYVDRIVVPYEPRRVLVYAGDNDLAEGRSPSQVLESFRLFVSRVRARLPDTRIAFISIKPSPARESLLPQIQEANGLIRQYAQEAAIDYIDVFSLMVDDAGHPRGDLFGPDALHMNATGYAVWHQAMESYVR